MFKTIDFLFKWVLDWFFLKTGFLNDLWIYSISNNTWTWVNGKNTGNATGVYGTQGTPDNTTSPGARYGSAVWSDNSDSVWLFGGFGYDETGTTQCKINVICFFFFFKYLKKIS